MAQDLFVFELMSELTKYNKQDVSQILESIHPLLIPLLPYVVSYTNKMGDWKITFRFSKMSEAPFQYGSAKKHFKCFEINVLGDHRQDPPVEIIVGNFKWY